MGEIGFLTQGEMAIVHAEARMRCAVAEIARGRLLHVQGSLLTYPTAEEYRNDPRNPQATQSDGKAQKQA